MKQNSIEQILAELYQTDPGLKQHDNVLRKLVVELMELRPDTQFDEQFRQELRRRLMNMETKQSTSLTHNFMKRFQLAGAGLAFVALLAVSVWYLGGIKNPSSPSNLSMMAGAKITRAGENAFGSLTNVQSAGRGGGMGAGGSEAMSTPSAAPDGGSGTSSMGSDAKMIAPEPAINFHYIYKGEELTLAQDKVDVLKRIKGESNGLSSFLSSISLGLLNLNSFGSTELQNFTFVEDRDMGYMVNVSLSEGSVSINENWSKWLSVTQTCPVDLNRGSDVASCQPRKVNISEVPADQVLIDAANAFIAEHNIPTANYGQPFVNNDWRMYYERTPDKANYWIPDVLSVVYPLVLNGQPVYDESGNQMGLNVSVRFVPQVKVSGVWELTTQNYQSSSYAAETDLKRIMGLVEKGGFRNYYYADASAKTVDVELGTPEVSYVKLWNYSNNNAEELLVPALIFPVTSELDSAQVGPYYWYRKNVVIPLVKEILDNENSGGPVHIMPAGGVSEPAVKPMMEDSVNR